MKVIIKSLLGMICALLLWEVILENTLEHSPGFTHHPILGRINKPGIAMEAVEGFSRTRINSLGMRGGEILPKAKNEYRILCLGDSYTKALHVSDDRTFAELLQKKLRSLYKSKLINTINGGRDGASPAYYIQLASFYNSTIQPDAVVVEINDVDFVDFMVDQKKQFHVVKENNTFKPVYIKNFSSDNALSKVILNKFPQLSFLLEYSVVRVGGENLRKSFATKEGNTENPNQKFKKVLESQNYQPLVDWTVQQLKNKYKEKLVILYLPFFDYQNFNARESPIENSLKAITKKYEVNFVDPRQDFIESYQLHHQPAYGFNNTTPGIGHMNEIGHEIIADSLADFFKERIAE